MPKGVYDRTKARKPVRARKVAHATHAPATNGAKPEPERLEQYLPSRKSETRRRRSLTVLETFVRHVAASGGDHDAALAATVRDLAPYGIPDMAIRMDTAAWRRAHPAPRGEQAPTGSRQLELLVAGLGRQIQSLIEEVAAMRKDLSKWN